MLTVAILAAGKGTRMASSMPKVLHKLSGKTLLQRVVDSCNELKPDKIYIIVGHKSKEVENSLIKNNNIEAFDDAIISRPWGLFENIKHEKGY